MKGLTLAAILAAFVLNAADADDIISVDSAPDYKMPFQPFSQPYTWQRIDGTADCIVIDPKGKENSVVTVGLFGYPDDDTSLIMSCLVTRDKNALDILRRYHQEPHPRQQGPRL